MTAMTPKQVETALMNMNRSYAALCNTYGSVEKLLDIAEHFACLKAQTTISRETIAIVMSAFAQAKSAIRPELTENYDETIIWTMISQGLFNESEDKGLPRVEKSLTAALAAVDESMKEQVK